MPCTQQGHATQETDIRKMKCDAVVEGEEGSWQVLVKCPSPQGTAELSSAPTKRDDISTVSCDVSAVQSSVSCDMSAVQSSSPSLQSPYVEADVYSINTHVAQISAAISSRPMQVGHATSGLLLVGLTFSLFCSCSLSCSLLLHRLFVHLAVAPVSLGVTSIFFCPSNVLAPL